MRQCAQLCGRSRAGIACPVKRRPARSAPRAATLAGAVGGSELHALGRAGSRHTGQSVLASDLSRCGDVLELGAGTVGFPELKGIERGGSQRASTTRDKGFAHRV